MSEIKHTPGPWFAVDNGNFWEVRTEDSRFGGEQIGDSCASNHIDEGDGYETGLAKANALVMAASAELLEALKEAIETIKFLSTRDNSWGEQIVCEDLQAIVAKATGA